MSQVTMFNPLMHDIPKCCKIFKVCVTILRHYALKRTFSYYLKINFFNEQQQKHFFKYDLGSYSFSLLLMTSSKCVENFLEFTHSFPLNAEIFMYTQLNIF